MSGKPLIFLSAGEVSGDMHGAHLARALLELRPDLSLAGVGSTRMAEAGVRVIADVTPCSAVGLSENLPHVLPVARAFAEARRFLAAERPALVVLIDYQGANMALAAHARRLGLSTLYYILPQEWLWGLRGGAAKVARGVDHLLAVFPREAEAYREAGGRVTHVGHPLIDLVPAVALRTRAAAEPPSVLLLPGSRPPEVARLLPAFLGAAERLSERFPGARFTLPVASERLRGAIAPAVTASRATIDVTAGGSLAAFATSDLAIAASGTATLEAALSGVPCVAAYRVSALTAFVARRLMRGPFVTLPNIVAGRAVIPELLQQRAAAEPLADEATRLLMDSRAIEQMREGYAEVRAALGGPGAIRRAAAAILSDAHLDLPVSVAPR